MAPRERIQGRRRDARRRRLQAARELKPHAITLDINLPDIDGWRVLDRLKDDLATRHVPVQLITTEEERERGLRIGAIGALTKPMRTKETLDEAFARIKAFIEPRDEAAAAGASRTTPTVSSSWRIGRRATDVDGHRRRPPPPTPWPLESDPGIRRSTWSSLGLELPDKQGSNWSMRSAKSRPADIPLVRLLDQELTKKEELHLKRLAPNDGAKGRPLARSGCSTRRPCSCTAGRRLPKPQRQLLEQLHQPGAVLAGRRF